MISTLKNEQTTMSKQATPTSDIFEGKVLFFWGGGHSGYAWGTWIRPLIRACLLTQANGPGGVCSQSAQGIIFMSSSKLMQAALRLP